jgi:hypothetical protein
VDAAQAEKPYSFVFDKKNDTWVYSVHGRTDFTAWVNCWAGCDGGHIDDYEDDPINCDPGDISSCPECHGEGGWVVCGECNIKNPDAEF